jgi:tetratricopeptide (TPR) repeat protein
MYKRAFLTISVLLIFFAGFLLSMPVHAENHHIKGLPSEKAWELYYQKEYEKALALSLDMYKSGKVKTPDMPILIGMLYSKTGQHESALAYLDYSKLVVQGMDTYARLFGTIKSIDKEREFRKAWIGTYREVTFAAVSSNEALGRWEKIISDIKEMQKRTSTNTMIDNMQLGFAYYKSGNYGEASYYFEKAYVKSDNNKGKADNAYSVGATKAKQGKTEESINWLKKSISHDSSYFLKIKSDSDFDQIREKTEFKNFLSNYSKEGLR